MKVKYVCKTICFYKDYVIMNMVEQLITATVFPLINAGSQISATLW